MVNPESVIVTGRPVETFFPPGVSVFLHPFPVIEGEAPVLAGIGVHIRRSSRRIGKIEQLPVHPDIGAVLVHQYGQITFQPQTSAFKFFSRLPQLPCAVKLKPGIKKKPLFFTFPESIDVCRSGIAECFPFFPVFFFVLFFQVDIGCVDPDPAVILYPFRSAPTFRRRRVRFRHRVFCTGKVSRSEHPAKRTRFGFSKDFCSFRIPALIFFRTRQFPKSQIGRMEGEGAQRRIGRRILSRILNGKNLYDIEAPFPAEITPEERDLGIHRSPQLSPLFSDDRGDRRAGQGMFFIRKFHAQRTRPGMKGWTRSACLGMILTE